VEENVQNNKIERIKAKLKEIKRKLQNVMSLIFTTLSVELGESSCEKSTTSDRIMDVEPASSSYRKDRTIL
jgi:hypothetical protein